jgi:hypothetical protein
MNYNTHITFRATEDEARTLKTIQRQQGAKSLSATLRAVIAKAAELELAPAKAERREETANV